MDAVIAAFYLGLLTFSLNGLQLIRMDQRARELAAKEEDLRRLLIKIKLRR